MTQEQIVKENILDDVGITLDESEISKIFNVNHINQYTSFGTYPIDCSKTPALKQLFETITVEIKIGYNDENKFVYYIYEYKYQHSQGGSNGYTVNKKSNLSF